MTTPTYDDIRQALRKLAEQSDGRFKFEEWTVQGNECLKAVLTWKRACSNE